MTQLSLFFLLSFLLAPPPSLAGLVGDDAEIVDLNETQFLPNPTRTGVRSKANTHGYPTNIVFKGMLFCFLFF